MSVDRLFGWTPFRAAVEHGEIVVDWCHLGARRMTEPFFYETIVNAMRQPFNLAFQQRTAARVLARLPPGIEPTGFVFHMSRCGSTLLSQALAAFEGNIVVSESMPMRVMLRAPAYIAPPREDTDALVKGIVNAYAQPRFSYENRFFVKFMAADVLDRPLITRLFPDTPWIFIYRDPLEILASQQAMLGADLMPGDLPPARLGLDADPFAMDKIAYRSHVLAAFGRAALASQAAGKSLFLDYSELPDALWEKIPAHFGFRLNASAEAHVRAVSTRNSKNPAVGFAADSAAKREAARQWRQTTDAIVGPVIEALDKARNERL